MANEPPSGACSRAPITIHTDGSCIGNPGPGGWAFLVEGSSDGDVVSGREPKTTNNRMELTAAIMALQATAHLCAAVSIVSDSEYLVKGMRERLPKWKANSWKTSAKKPVLNADLWKRLDALSADRHVSWNWVRAHSGNEANERVDSAARAAAQTLAPIGDHK